jgi:hypothetical protein
MNLNQIQDELIGVWTGNNLLRLSWLTPSDFVSQSELSVSSVAKGKFLKFDYTWNHEGVSQEGMILFGYDMKAETATGAWVDSWHQSSKVMSCQGTIDSTGTIDLRGSYEAPPGPDWGWRFVINAPSGSELKLAMYNVSPDGEEELAVEANYKRAQQ